MNGFAFFRQQCLRPQWVILVGRNYGAVVFTGSKQHAEDFRKHKANWEGAIAKKRPISWEDTYAPSDCWNHRGFLNRTPYVCFCSECRTALSNFVTELDAAT